MTTQVVNIIDADATTFIAAAGITNLIQASAINTLVNDLKTYGLWTKMKAIYPFVGGSATSHKFNLKDPRDLDAAYRLVFNGGWVHSSTGALPNGTTGYADTKLSPSSTLTNYSSHLSFYSRTNRGSGRQSASIGSYLTPNEISLRFNFLASGGLNNSSMSAQYDGYGLDFATYTTSTTNYFLIGNRTANNINKVYENGVLKSTNTTTTTKVLPSARVLIGALSDGNTNVIWYDNLESAFATIGDGLTDAEATSLYTSVQTYQTSLGRSVNTPVYNNGLVLNLDAGNANSYPGTGTTWFDLASGNNGTLLNGPTYDVNNGGSILFDGVNDYVDLGSNLKLNDSDITYDFWFKLTDNSDVYREIITIGSSNQSNSISLWKYRSGLNSGKVFANINIVGFTQTMTISQLTGVDILNTIVNYTAVFKKESGVYKLYLYRNGVLDASTTSNVTSYNMNNWTNFESRIGSGSSTYPELWKGNIYSGKVWSRALSATEILNNFNSTRGRFGL